MYSGMCVGVVYSSSCTPGTGHEERLCNSLHKYSIIADTSTKEAIAIPSTVPTDLQYTV